MFFSVIPKNLNWEILTKNVVTFKRWDGAKDEKFKYYWVPWKIWFLRGVTKTKMPKKKVRGQFSDLRKRLGKKEGFGVFEGSLIPQCTLWWQSVLWIFPKMPSEIFCSKICWQNSAKASFMYQQWTATVLIFLKVPTTDSLVFFWEYISRTAVLMQASVITCK